MVLDPEKKTFSVKAGRGLPQGVAGSSMGGAGEGVAGWAVQNRISLIITGQKGPADLRERLSQPDLVSSIVLPIERNSNVVAVVNLSSKEKRLRHEDLEWLNERARELLEREPEALSA
jgi:putative methionine-R-sulfoxide reductase with GAF domain